MLEWARFGRSKRQRCTRSRDGGVGAARGAGAAADGESESFAGWPSGSCEGDDAGAAAGDEQGAAGASSRDLALGDKVENHLVRLLAARRRRL